jgi:membrane fusion protein (multidrug efflux system)
MQEAQVLDSKTSLRDSAPPVREAARIPAARPAPRPFIILGIVVAVGLSGLGVHATMVAGEESTDDGQIAADVVPLAPRISGTVKAVLVSDNQRVRKGQLLLLLDQSELAARVAQAKAELLIARAQADAAQAQVQIVSASAQGGLSSAKAMVSGSELDVRGAEAQIAVAQAALLHARAQAHKAQLDLDRVQSLHAGGAASQEQLDGAQIANDTAQATLAQAAASLAAAGEQRGAAHSRVAQAKGTLAASTPADARIAAARAEAALARARVQSTEAMLQIAELQFERAELTAPDDGIVSKLSVRAGQIVNANQTLAELVPTRSYVVANFKETQVGAMRPGQAAEIRVDAYPRHPFHAKVESLSAGTGSAFSLLPPDNASGNFVKVVQRVPVRLSFVEPPDRPLRVGLSADVTVSVR